ncbi:DUF2726 domain-containing protein [Candidatus Pantoea persica]|uniref:DUF2726 domain-containing protein n=1 Tax=Candidatus Pantoea persica TaxID=2518128 RepID=UPI00215D7B01|nr:DUF2726 domain-containing protein [Candidatus Pantoea persica]
MPGSDSKPAYGTINSKRADFVIIDRSGQSVAVVEYQYHGASPYEGDASARDAIKREVCSSMAMVFIELPARYSDADITAIIKHLTATVV